LLDLDYKVLKLLYRSDNLLKVGDLANHLYTAHSTIGSCVKRLEKEKLVLYKRYKHVILSESGKNLAIELIRHAQLMEVLFYNALGLTKEKAHQESEKFNLLLSCETVNRICEKYEHPKECPCGVEILDALDCHCEKKI
jgi:DtxR family Mn-dependent transcriptional regulator